MAEERNEIREVVTHSVKEAIEWWTKDIAITQRLLDPLAAKTGWSRSDLLALMIYKRLEWLGATPKPPQEPWQDGGGS